jgi:CheY-like chemotaxis protein
VADTGQGIPQAFLPHLFDRFRQADAGITRKHGGLGLGLALVRHIVELHGGTVEVATSGEGEGEGATLVVKLPLMPVKREPAPASIAHPSPIELRRFECPSTLAGVRVLVVDDEPDTREMLAMVLGECDAEVLGVGSAAEAIDAIDAWSPDVLISDIGMPWEDGYGLIERVRKRPPEAGGRIPAVALTAFARLEDRMRALAAGFQMHVAKPVEPAELVMVVHSLLEFKQRQ